MMAMVVHGMVHDMMMMMAVMMHHVMVVMNRLGGIGGDRRRGETDNQGRRNQQFLKHSLVLDSLELHGERRCLFDEQRLNRT